MAMSLNFFEENKHHKYALVFALLAASALAKDDARVTYGGDGRYTCSGNNASCAKIDTYNHQREAQRQAEYQRDQDRAQSVVDRERRKEETRRPDR